MIKTPAKRARNAQERRKPDAPMPTPTDAARALGARGGAARARALKDNPARRQEIARSGGLAAAQRRREKQGA